MYKRQVKGDVLLPFSMDKTVYFPTLDQYQYNRGMVIRAHEGDAVCSVTEGRIIAVSYTHLSAYHGIFGKS